MTVGPGAVEDHDSRERGSMNAIGIGVSLLAVVFVFWLFYRMQRLKLQVAGFASQRMCPACGLITPRSKAACLECGTPFLNAWIAPRDRR